jgi:hypothetical protein
MLNALSLVECAALSPFREPRSAFDQRVDARGSIDFPHPSHSQIRRAHTAAEHLVAFAVASLLIGFAAWRLRIGGMPVTCFLEKWTALELRNGDVRLVDAAGVEVCRMVPDLGIVSREYARRIAARVNALRGLESECIEAMFPESPLPRAGAAGGGAAPAPRYGLLSLRLQRRIVPNGDGREVRPEGGKQWAHALHGRGVYPPGPSSALKRIQCKLHRCLAVSFAIDSLAYGNRTVSGATGIEGFRQPYGCGKASGSLHIRHLLPDTPA